jgi:hypothetical protein
MSTLAERPSTSPSACSSTSRFSSPEVIRLRRMYQALHQRGRRVLRVQLGRDTASGLRQIEETLGG